MLMLHFSSVCSELPVVCPNCRDDVLSITSSQISLSCFQCWCSYLRYFTTRILISFLVFASAASLQTLRGPRSDISDSIVEQIAGRLSTITFLDVSYCTKISGCALEATGKHCKLLVGLCRNMHPLDTESMETQDDEAYAIATTMPQLKRLEMAYHLVSTESLLQILSSCTELEFMDLRGCWNVNLDDKFVRRALQNWQYWGLLQWRTFMW